MIVVDASAVLELLLRTPRSPIIETSIFAAGQTLHAPHLLDLEVTQVLRRFTLKRELHGARAEIALDDFLGLHIQRYAHDLFLPRVWQLRSNITAYDAVYVALSEALQATLMTHDKRLAQAARRYVEVEVV